MRVNNPLTREFIINYPADAARTLEQISAAHVAALFTELPVDIIVTVMRSMIPAAAADCIENMPPEKAARLLTELPATSAARIYRLVIKDKQKEIKTHISDKTLRRMQQFMVYPVQSAGALLDAVVDMLPQTITVSEALRYIEDRDDTARCEIYIIDDAHHLVGTVELGKLLVSDHSVKLREVMIRKIPSVSVHADITSLLSHPAWAKRRRLPVVERDNTLLGALDYSYLQASAGEAESSVRDPLENILSLASLYWISVAQLLDSVLSKSGTGRRGRS